MVKICIECSPSINYDAKLPTNFMKKIWLSTTLLFVSLAFFNLTFAETASVSSFSVPSSLESGQIADLTWTINGGGHSLIVFCAQGIKLRYSITNLPFPCDTKVSVSKYASDGVSLLVANVSGSPRIVTVRIIPKNPNGATDYDPGAREATIYVNPSRQPFSTFHTNATSTVSGAATTFYWSSAHLDGVNFKIACNDFITATSTAYGPNILPCNRIIFPTDLPGTGSVTFKFNNQSEMEKLLNVTLFPAMSPGMYDGINAKTITLTVASDAQKPVSVRFNASRNKIFSGDSILFDWSVINGSGANIKFACSPTLKLRAFSVSTTTTLACGNYAWPTNFAPNASTSVTFLNLNTVDEISTATLFPTLKNGIYDGNNAQTIRINVAPVPNLPQNTQATNASTVQTPTSTVSGAAKVIPATTVTTPVTIGKNVFTKWLSVGSRSADVTLLQQFLAKDKSLYPERLVTGYFGPATKRAVGRFQIRFGLIKNTKDPSYGALDAKTRFSLNALQ